MQIISNVHHCLYFKLNKQKYLFGLTYTLFLDSSALRKTVPDHLILPSNPYLPSLSLFLWQLQALPQLKTKSIIVADLTVKKRIQHLMYEQCGLNPHDFKWDFFQQCQIDEEIIIKLICEQKVAQPLAVEPKGIGFNLGLQYLNLIVAEKGRTVFILHGCDVTVLDPGENIEQLLLHYGIPLKAVKTIILTDAQNLNFFECLMKLETVRLVAEENVYLEVKRKLKVYFHWDQKMIRVKLRGKVFCEPMKNHHLGALIFSYRTDQKGQTQFWNICFGLKQIRIYPGILDHFPQELISISQLEYLVIYEMQSQIKKSLEQCPQVYRRKVIFNRVDKKYNHKYFVTLSPKAQLLTIQAHKHVQGQLLKQPTDVSFQFKERDVDGRLQRKILKDKEVFNGNERVVYIRRGYVRNSQKQLFGMETVLISEQMVVGEGGALIMFEPIVKTYFYHGRQRIDYVTKTVSESVLSRVKENSFISSLSRTTGKNNDPLRQKMTEEQYELDSQWDIINRISRMRTFEAGSQEIDSSKYLYFVTKGGLKFKSQNEEDTIAAKNMMIGNIKKLYDNFYNEENPIEVLKDTWAVEVDIKQLHQTFFAYFPEKMYELFIKPMIFI